MHRFPLALVLAFFYLTASVSAQGVVIIPTFASNILSNPSSAQIQATINAAIAEYNAKLLNPGVTVRITFQDTSTGLGGSSTFYTQVTYTAFRNALIAHSTTPDDASSLAFLPAGANSPVPASAPGNVTLTLGNARALGLASNSGSTDSTISLNLSLMNFTRTSINPAKYDLKAVAQHEIDEVLGTASNVGQTSGIFLSPTPADHTRFGSPGVFSYATGTGLTPYFSVNGGVTNLATYNQNGSGDYGDFAIGLPSGSPVRVQDWAGTPGTTPDLGVELRLLDVIGWNLAVVPEPTTIAFIGLAGASAVGAWWHSRRQLIKLADKRLYRD